MRRSNIHRASRFSLVVKASPYFSEDPHAEKAQHLFDMLADMRHYCDRHGLDFADCDRVGHSHYLAELADNFPLASEKMPP